MNKRQTIGHAEHGWVLKMHGHIRVAGAKHSPSPKDQVYVTPAGIGVVMHPPKVKS